jgi:uncharacterized protein (DUF1778 family)
MSRRGSNSQQGESAEQLNVRLAPERYEVLRAAAFVRGAANLRELVLPTLDALIDELAKDEAVRLALRGRQLERARDDGVVQSLPRQTAAEE